MGYALAGLFRAFRDGVALERRHAQARLLVTFGVVQVVISAGCFALMGMLLWAEWPHLLSSQSARKAAPDPLALVSLGVMLVFNALFVSGLTLASNTIGSYGRPLPSRWFAWALTRAIEEGDLTIAPALTANLDATQAASTEVSTEVSDELGIEGETLGPLAHPNRSLAYSNVTYVACVLGGIVLAGSGLAFCILPNLASEPIFSALRSSSSLYSWFQVFEFSLYSWLIGLACVAPGCAIVAWALVAHRFARMERQVFRVQLDMNGIIVHPSESHANGQRIVWRNVRGFARIRYQDDLLRERDVYILSAMDQDILWEAPPVSRYVAPEVSQREQDMRAAAYRLVERVTPHVRTPLLDVTMAVQTALIGSGGSFSSTAWNVADRAIPIARRDGDNALARDLWARLHPSRRMPATWLWNLGAELYSAQVSHAQRQNLLRLARALIPYFPAPQQITPSQRQRWLIRNYWRFAIGLQCMVIVWAVVSLFVFSLRLPHGF